jgi:hypothetical protein
VSGTGFLSTSVVQVGGTAETTNYVSDTQLTATVPATQLASAGQLAVVVSNGSVNSGVGTPINLDIDNPSPIISSILITGNLLGATAPAITLTGTGFVSTTVIDVNGTARPTTYISATQLSVTLTTADVATAGYLALVAVSPSPGGGTSPSVTLQLDNPSVGAIQLNPSALSVGATSPTTIKVTGNTFVSTSVVQVNGIARTTTYVNPTTLTFVATVADQATAGSLSVTVTNPPPGGETSPAASLTINNPSVGTIQLNPSSLTVGAASPTIITVTGNTFVPSSVVQVNGNARTTTYVSSTTLTFAATVADQAAAGSLSVTVTNPAPGGGTSSAQVLQVNNPSVGIIQLNPSTLIAGATSPATITVTGNTFVPTSVVQVNSVVRATTYVNPTTLTFVATVADQATAGTLLVDVANPLPGGGISPVADLTVTGPPPTPVITSVTPNSITVGSTDTVITIFGTGLTANSVVLWNGTALVASPYLGYTLTATVPAADLTTVGTASLTVKTPTANPPVSNALTVNITSLSVPTLTSVSPVGGPINTGANVTLIGTGFTALSTVAVNGSNIAATYVSSTELTVAIPAASFSTPDVYPITVTNPAPQGGTSSSLYFTAYVPIANNSMVYNPVNGLFYLSVPSAAGAPYGNTVVSVDPVTGALGTPIPVGSEPDRLAITADGKYLWVALDGACAVRKVDLVAGTAGLQFSLASGGSSQSTVAALAALPGAADSVVVSTYLGIYTSPTGVSLTIYDSGVPRSSVVDFSTYATFPWALIVNGTTNEIYGPGNSPFDSYNTYAYSAAGVTAKSSTYSTLTYANSNTDEVQIVGGNMYTDYGQVVNPETGTLLDTFYSSGTAAAQGSIAIDSTLGLAFILEGYYGSTQYQLGAFDLSNFNATTAAPIPIYNPTFRASYQYAGPSSNRLTRWGADGLAFRDTGGFVSLRTSMVQDLSTIDADLGVAITATGTNSTGNTTTYAATVTNNGPAAATSVALTASLPSTGVLTSVTSSAGSCSTTGGVTCDLGGLGNGASATVVFSVLQTSAGSAVMTVQVSASENDPVLSNNQAQSTLNITGSDYNLAPTLSAISPAGIVSGSSDTTITLTGANFTSGSIVLLNGTALITNFSSSTELSATVPQADLANLGWAAISVSNPSPGGGTSSSLPLSVFSVLSLGANHILYDPYSRKIMASVGTGTSTVTGNSIVAITPDTASIGTPVSIGGTPTNLALTSDGQILYTLLPGSSTGSIARFNMLAQQADFTVSGFEATGYNTGLRDIATQPGAENTVAVDQGEYIGISIFDFNPMTKTATARGTATGTYTGTCLAFPNASSMFAVDLYGSGIGLELYSVTSNGLVNGSYPYDIGSAIQNLNCYKLSGSLLFAQAGGVANTDVAPAVQAGVFEGMPNISTYGAGVKDFDPDASLGLSFYLTDVSPNDFSAIFDSITTFSNETFAPVSALSLPFETFEGNTGFTGVDVFRWGQDGLAVLSSGGNVYLVRGGAIVPELLTVNSAASLTASSTTSITHGSGNTLLTLTGSNFVPGMAVTWNGSYRTTTLVNSTQATVAIPASDLVSTGTASLVATNPGAPGSNTLQITIN